MRTTLSLDADVAAAVERLRAEQQIGMSEAVNQLARAGLAVRRQRVTFHQATVDVGLRIDVSNVAAALEQLDGPNAR